ncbi:hypothetical protein LNKW23_29750 [Paralimibaculum aggregatum]|uniref:TadE-like domain-containing protein n=1 Tax=Paralimibaculum aggregatum TaxID=3036245 RepID=A0ABQ6LKI7_9RHOB|nr:TadE/TadG family type IV pilus assembly protein [Limibaculum sp. NKW23]GMG83761.1 hypothetical protein LNKW23_29750 [Limibaculum sp. NKW23]
MRDGLGSFLAAEEGAASLEFVVTLPLLLGPLVITAEYGQALAQRERLDMSLADAAQMLSQAPAMPGLTAEDAPLPYSHFVDKARDMVRANLGPDATLASFAVSISGDLSQGMLSRPFYRVRLRAEVALDLRLLSFVNAFTAERDVPRMLTLTAHDEIRYAPAVPPIDNIDCGWDDLYECADQIMAATPELPWADARSGVGLTICLPGDLACID